MLSLGDRIDGGSNQEKDGSHEVKTVILDSDKPENFAQLERHCPSGKVRPRQAYPYGADDNAVPKSEKGKQASSCKNYRSCKRNAHQGRMPVALRKAIIEPVRRCKRGDGVENRGGQPVPHLLSPGNVNSTKTA